MTTKTCARCSNTKPLDQFHKCSKSKDGLHSYCKQCRREVHLTAKCIDCGEKIHLGSTRCHKCCGIAQRKTEGAVDGKLRCTKCKEVKPVTEFRINRRHWTGYTSWCKDCLGKYSHYRWIPVEEKLPLNTDYVLELTADGYYLIGYYDGDFWWYGYEFLLEGESAVTHWAPIRWPKDIE